jgi:hypothetical protein
MTAEAATAQPAPSATPAPAANPAVTGESFNLSTYRKAKEAGTAGPDSPEYKAPAAKSEPAKAEPADDDVDPETEKEIEAREQPKDGETPAEKRARTLRHKEAARKAIATRLANQRDAARRERDEAARELEEWRSGRRSAQPRDTGGTPPAETPNRAGAEPETTSETRPKPTLKDFPLEKFTQEDDPYAAQQAALSEAVIDWKDEQRASAARDSHRRAQREQEQRQIATKYGEQVTEAKSRLTDFDAVIAALDAAVPKTALGADLHALVIRSDVGADVAYHLGRNPEALKFLTESQTFHELSIRFGEVQADVKRTRKAAPPAAAAPTKITAAAEPLQPVTAHAATGVSVANPALRGTEMSTLEYRRWKRANGR